MRALPVAQLPTVLGTSPTANPSESEAGVGSEQSESTVLSNPREDDASKPARQVFELDTLIVENRSNLSGGQRQLVALARA